MPGKSRRRRDKRFHKNRVAASVRTDTVDSPVPVKVPMPAARPNTVPTLGGVSAPASAAPGMSYPYIKRELLNISLIAGIILVIIVVIAIVLR